jgi:tight adherence protein B
VAAFVAGARDLTTLSDTRRQIVATIIGDEAFGRTPALTRWDRVFRATRPGRRLERELVLAGVNQKPLTVLLVGVGVSLAALVVLWKLLAPLFGVLGLLAGVWAVRTYLARERGRRLEAFIAQMPELARVLANATNAGLSINTAIAVAAEELEEPAGSEMQRVAQRLTFGSGLDVALDELTSRLPSREIAILASTLLVSARSGGSLVAALRTIADTLEDRKETRREIRTTLAQALATGYLVIAMGFGMLLLVNGISPGAVDKMTRSPVGELALIVSGTLFIGGFLIVRRMTRFDL